MLAAVEAALPADIAVCAAAVADWRSPKRPSKKSKNTAGQLPRPRCDGRKSLISWRPFPTPGNKRPALVVGFAAETDDVIENATEKRARKGCDWIVANDVSPATGTFAGDDQHRAPDH